MPKQCLIKTLFFFFIYSLLDVFENFWEKSRLIKKALSCYNLFIPECRTGGPNVSKAISIIDAWLVGSSSVFKWKCREKLLRLHNLHYLNIFCIVCWEKEEATRKRALLTTHYAKRWFQKGVTRNQLFTLIID